MHLQKKLTSLTILLTLLLTSQGLFAQQHVVKVRPFNAFFQNFSPSYEYVLNDKQSINVSAGYTFPITVDLDNIELQDGTRFSLSDARISGYSITPEYRFYLINEAPRGIYLAPYLRHNRISLSATEQIAGIESDLDISYSVTTPGVLFGVQWLIADRVSIDWHIAGLGYGLYVIGGSVETQTPPNDITEWQNEVERIIGNTPGLPGNDTPITTSDGNSRLEVSLPGGGITMRTGLSVGIAF